MVKSGEKEDPISNLPDCLIHYILSFLPSTKEAVRTGILSKRWRNQWTRVPVLIFDSTSKSFENLLKFIDNTLVLHDCSKIKKFHLDYLYGEQYQDPQITEKIRFATEKHVECLYLSLLNQNYILPKFLFNNASLVQLSAENCTFTPNGTVNWGCLTVLNMKCCQLADQAMDHILSGSPLLRSFELEYGFFMFKNLCIASKSLKRLVLLHIVVKISDLEIVCPNLEELSLEDVTMDDSELFAQVIENVLSGSLLLESFELIGCSELQHLSISSKSLKRLVLGKLRSISRIEISCPKLKKLKLFGYMNVRTAKLLSLPSSLCATIDFDSKYWYDTDYRVIPKSWIEIHKKLFEDILQQLQHVNELRIGRFIIEVLSYSLELTGGLFLLPTLNVKCLTLTIPPVWNQNYGIACILRNSPVLEKLVIDVPTDYLDHVKFMYSLKPFEENYWSSNDTVFDCLVSHLKIIKIVLFPKKDHKSKLLLNFVGFLLENARVLEKMVVLLENDETNCDPFEFSQELLSLPRCSQYANIEFAML